MGAPRPEPYASPTRRRFLDPPPGTSLRTKPMCALRVFRRPTPRSHHLHRRASRIGGALLVLVLAACASRAPSVPTTRVDTTAFLDTVQRRTFAFFWETTNPRNGLAPDRWPNPPFSSIAAIGFALTAYPIGIERGWVERQDAANRTLTTLRYLWRLPQGPDSAGLAGYKGFYYHFLDMQSGERFRNTELSTIDTGLMFCGVLFAQQYFDRPDSVEAAIRAYADSLYERADWTWFIRDRPLITMAWYPERGYGPAAYEGYNEAMFLYVLALGSPTHPVDPGVWERFTRTYHWAPFYGYAHVNFAPLFGHQYSHVWIDFRGIRDPYMRARGIDYFENSRRATLSQRRYAIDNPGNWREYGPNVWGLTASDGPTNATLPVDGRARRFHTYWARGAAATEILDDGTIAPTAAGGAVPFAPDVAIAALLEMRTRYGDDLFTRYGFVDAFNATLQQPGVQLERGRIVPGKGWFDDNHLGIDQGPILAMIENHRTGLVWRYMREHPAIVRGLCRAGFTGGWLEGRC